MAQIVPTKTATDLLLVAILFLLAMATPSSEATSKYKSPRLKETNLVFYMHDYFSGRNITVVDIAGPANQPFDILKFGNVVAIDDKLTESPEWNSPQVGRARGIYANTAVDNRDVYLLMSFVFTNREFNGSTLEIQGSDDFNYKIRELSVVSGTGKFRMAQGFGLLSTISFDIQILNTVLKWNVTVFHY